MSRTDDLVGQDPRLCSSNGRGLRLDGLRHVSCFATLDEIDDAGWEIMFWAVRMEPRRRTLIVFIRARYVVHASCTRTQRRSTLLPLLLLLLGSSRLKGSDSPFSVYSATANFSSYTQLSFTQANNASMLLQPVKCRQRLLFQLFGLTCQSPSKMCPSPNKHPK